MENIHAASHMGLFAKIKPIFIYIQHSCTVQNVVDQIRWKSPSLRVEYIYGLQIRGHTSQLKLVVNLNKQDFS